MKRVLFGVGVGVALLHASAWAQTDSEGGIVEACAACHGEEGISQLPDTPNLAGQKVTYLADQMKAYRDGLRQSALMAPLVQGLSDKQIIELAKYYAELTPEPVAPNETTPSEAGKNVSAQCISCHGMHGKTVNEQWPNLAGQKKAYLVQQLKAFRSGDRAGPVMSVIVGNLTDQQIEHVATYYSQLSP